MSAKRAVSTYSEALFELAFEEWLRELNTAWKDIGKDNALLAALDDAAAPFEERKSKLDDRLPEGLSEKARNFLYLLASKHDLHLLDEVIRDFDNQVRGRKLQRQTAQVTSAIPLTNEEKQALEAKLSEQFGVDLRFDYAVDTAILGGIRVRVGDRVIDGTVAKRLEALKEQLEISA